MSAISTVSLERLADQIVHRLTVEMEASGRHVHLSRAHVEALFGPGYQLNRVKDLSQPGQFACAERVTLEGPKGILQNVVVLGPERPESQVEISLTDARALGIDAPVRLSGDTAGTPGITVEGPAGRLDLDHGVLAAQRHIHMTPADAARYGLQNGDTVSIQCLSARPLILQGVAVRVSDRFATYVHIDFDEANACGHRRGDLGRILHD